MELSLYILLLIYFLTGAIVIFVINRNKNVPDQKHNWLKYSTYFIILNILFLSIHLKLFTFFAAIIILGGIFEILNLTIRTHKIRFGIFTFIIFSLAFYSFFQLSFEEQTFLYFFLFIVTVFDAFCQLSGQLTGRRKLFPTISRNKTIEGLLGGYLFSLLTAMVLSRILTVNPVETLIRALIISSLAFSGDFIASVVKRKFGVKDFSNFIPGHGGFLDRFDSLVFGSLFIWID